MIRELRYELPAGWRQEVGVTVEDAGVASDVALAEGVRRGAARGPVAGDPVAAEVVEDVYVLGARWVRRTRWVVTPGGDPRVPGSWAQA